MKREWKPGDVAMVTLPGGEQAIGVRPLRNNGWDHSGAFAGGADYDNIGETDARPLVVIDPEDREQVERLSDLRKRIDRSGENLMHWEDMQAALREFANLTPPKPEEPTGLGAVVEDAEGRRFVRQPDGWWRSDEPCAVNWAGVAAVRILSPGWSE